MSKGAEIFVRMKLPAKLLQVSGRVFIFLLALLFLSVEALGIFFLICLLELFSSRSEAHLRSDYSWLLLGFLTPLVGFLQLELYMLSVVWILLYRQKYSSAALLAVPFLVTVLLSFFITIYLEAGNYVLLFGQLAEKANFWHTFYNLRLAAREYSFPGTQQIFEILRYVVFFGLLFIEESRLKKIRDAYFKGLLPGAGLALLYAGLELRWPELQELGHMNAYWRSIGRNSASFSDPNAYGLFAFLMIPICHLAFLRSHSKWRQGYVMLAVLWVVLAPFSGSRSFFLGCILYVSFVIAFSRYRRYLWLLLLCASLLFIFDAPATLRLLSVSLPVGVERTLNSLDLSALYETFRSRIIFWQIALAVWTDHLLFGVGLTEFPLHVVRYAEQLNLGTQFWVDNANSYYLGVLAELGLSGAMLLVLAISPIRISEPGKDLHAEHFIYVATFLSFLILLMLGPHLEFVEILLPLVLFLRPLFFLTQSNLGKQWLLLFFSLIVCARVIRDLCPLSVGLYHWERNQDLYVRWIRPHARFLVACEDGRAEITLRVPRPAIHKHPVLISIEAGYFQAQTLRFADHQPKKISFSCDAERLRELDSSFLSPNLPVRIQMSSGFIPQRQDIRSKDLRLLGAQLIDLSSRRVF